MCVLRGSGAWRRIGQAGQATRLCQACSRQTKLAGGGLLSCNAAGWQQPRVWRDVWLVRQAHRCDMRPKLTAIPIAGPPPSRPSPHIMQHRLQSLSTLGRGSRQHRAQEAGLGGAHDGRVGAVQVPVVVGHEVHHALPQLAPLQQLRGREGSATRAAAAAQRLQPSGAARPASAAGAMPAH